MNDTKFTAPSLHFNGAKDQDIHNYYGQKRRNDVIIEKALQVLPKDYALHAYKNFQYTEREKTDVVDTPLLLDEELPF